MSISQSLKTRLAKGLSQTANRIEQGTLNAKMRAAGFSQAEKIFTFTNPAELQQLFVLAAGCPPQADVLEIGSYLGAASCYLLAGLDAGGGKLTCVDTWQNETMPDGPRDTFAEFQRNTAPAAARLTMLRRNSAELGADDLPESLALAFIDGDHSYAAVRHDIAITAPRIAANGVLAFHDAVYFAGVIRALGELLTQGEWMLGGKVHSLLWLVKNRPPN